MDQNQGNLDSIFNPLSSHFFPIRNFSLSSQGLFASQRLCDQLEKELLEAPSNQQNYVLCRRQTEHREAVDEDSLSLSQIEDFENPFNFRKSYLEEEEKIKKAKTTIKKSHSRPIQPTIQQDQADSAEKSSQCIGYMTKNETKNIPKNFGKAIITFINKYHRDIQPILNKDGVDYLDFVSELSRVKNNVNTIASLRTLWTDFKYCQSMRSISNQFLRKHSLRYIFNSRISNYSTHIKYRRRLQEALVNPKDFKHIKDY